MKNEKIVNLSSLNENDCFVMADEEHLFKSLYYTVKKQLGKYTTCKKPSGKYDTYLSDTRVVKITPSNTKSNEKS